MPSAAGITAGSFVKLALGLVAALVGIVGYVLLSAPWWNFHLGGHFHPFGGWRGTGTLHSTTAGGDYTLWIQFELVPPTRSGRPDTVTGSAVLCSPRGEYLPLRMRGQALRRHGDDLTGVPLQIQMNRWVPLAIPAAVQSPKLEFHATFGDDVLILEDRGSLGQAFGPDGRVRESPAQTPLTAESIRVTLEKSTLPRLPDGCVI